MSIVGRGPGTANSTASVALSISSHPNIPVTLREHNHWVYPWGGALHMFYKPMSISYFVLFFLQPPWVCIEWLSHSSHLCVDLQAVLLGIEVSHSIEDIILQTGWSWMSTTAEGFSPIFTPIFMAVFSPRSSCPLCLMTVNSASLLCCWPIYLLEPDCCSLSMTIGLFYHIWYLIFSALDLSLTALPSSFFPWCPSCVCVIRWTVCLSLYISLWHGCHRLLNPFILWGIIQHAWCELTHVSPSLTVIIDDLIFSQNCFVHLVHHYPPKSLSACLGFGENCCTVSPGFWHISRTKAALTCVISTSAMELCPYFTSEAEKRDVKRGEGKNMSRWGSRCDQKSCVFKSFWNE